VKIGRKIFVTEFGSSVYGTRVPTSDRDVKGIFIPTAEDILLQKAGLTAFQESTKEDPSQANTSADQDTEWITLQAFLRLCAEGQSIALEMLFIPRQFWIEFDPLWLVIQRDRERLVSKVKLRELNLALLLVPGKAGEFVRLVKLPNGQGQEEPGIIVCDRALSLNVSVKYALQVLQKILDQYGARARLAEESSGADWKAVMHAVRVLGQAKELLSTGQLTFPRPNAAELLEIRCGLRDYSVVTEALENGLREIEILQENSSLSEAVDEAYWTKWLLGIYASSIQGQCPGPNFRGLLEVMLKSGTLHSWIQWLDAHGLLVEVFPDIARMKGVAQDIYYHFEGDVFVHTMMVLEKSRPGVVAQLAALLHDIAKPATQSIHEIPGQAPRIKFLRHESLGAKIADELLRSWGFGEEVVAPVCRIIELHLRAHTWAEWTPKAVRKFIRDCGPFLDEVLDLTEIDSLSSFGPDGQPRSNTFPDLRLMLSAISDVKKSSLIYSNKSVLHKTPCTKTL
jgi:hypothetical protein